MPFSPLPEIIAAIRAGKMIIITDDENRENEGDVVVAAQKATPRHINFMVRYARGLVCAALGSERADALALSPMTYENTSAFTTAFTVSVDAARGITTGISAFDRARTVRLLSDPRVGKDQFAVPGHIFPLRAREGGVLVRAGHTEASVDLMRMAGLEPAAVICEAMRDDGTMAKLPDLRRLAARWGLKMVSVAQIIEHRRRSEKLVARFCDVDMPTAWGRFRLIGFKSAHDGKINLALVKGGPFKPSETVLVRVHSECFTGDVLHSCRCDCGEQLRLSLERIEKAKRGVLVYMQQEGRGIGLADKLRAYELQDQGLDTVEANEKLGYKPDLREYGIGAQILLDLGVRRMRLLTNNPKKVVGLEGFGLKVTERVPILGAEHEHNRRYLQTKRKKLGHYLPASARGRKEGTR